MRRRVALGFALTLVFAFAAVFAPHAASAGTGIPTAVDEPAEVDAAISGAGSQPVYRFWSATFDNAHFYTVNLQEALRLHSSDRNWKYEGLDFRVWPAKNGACSAGTSPTYRFWSSKFASHFFTTNSAEATKVRTSDRNWSYEGVAFCTTTSTSNTVPVHRFWSSKFGKHFYTANAAEAAQLRSGDHNWRYEGVAWRSPSSGASVPQPNQPRPPQGYSCPAGYPIKGNHSSSGELIYHVPGGAYYDVTKPEECFATEGDARAAGYRPSKR